MGSLKIKSFNLPGDLPLLTGTLLQVIYFSVLLKLQPYKRIVESIERKSQFESPANEAQLGEYNQEELRAYLSPAEKEKLVKIYRAASFYLRRCLRTKRPCLRRALILYRWCRKRKIKAAIIIGVRKTDKELESHAWLEIGGKPFYDRPEVIETYTSILED